MILLISEANYYKPFDLTFKFHYDSINFIVSESDTVSFSSFKFHYDSINFRPKIIPLFKPKNDSILSTSSKFNISFLSLIIYFCNTSYFRRFRLLSIPYIFCTIMGRQKPLIFQVDFVRHILLWNLFAKYASWIHAFIIYTFRTNTIQSYMHQISPSE